MQGYYVIAAVRDPEKMDEAAAELGIEKKDFQVAKMAPTPTRPTPPKQQTA